MAEEDVLCAINGRAKPGSGDFSLFVTLVILVTIGEVEGFSLHFSKLSVAKSRCLWNSIMCRHVCSSLSLKIS